MFITVSSCFVCVYLCMRVRAHTHSMECDLLIWVRTNLRRGEEWLGRVLIIPPTPDTLRSCTRTGGILWTEREKKRMPPEWVRRRIQSHRNGKLHFRHGGKFPSNSSFLCNLC